MVYIYLIECCVNKTFFGILNILNFVYIIYDQLNFFTCTSSRIIGYIATRTI